MQIDWFKKGLKDGIPIATGYLAVSFTLGIAAKKVGIKMKEISKKHQVICVTHLAQIAAKGDYNYFIKKEVKDNKTNTKIEQLTEEGTIREIARIATGEINEISLKHAKELRKEKVA